MTRFELAFFIAFDLLLITYGVMAAYICYTS